jgi:hypothetical protein
VEAVKNQNSRFAQCWNSQLYNPATHSWHYELRSLCSLRENFKIKIASFLHRFRTMTTVASVRILSPVALNPVIMLASVFRLWHRNSFSGALWCSLVLFGAVSGHSHPLKKNYRCPLVPFGTLWFCSVPSLPNKPGPVSSLFLYDVSSSHRSPLSRQISKKISHGREWLSMASDGFWWLSWPGIQERSSPRTRKSRGGGETLKKIKIICESKTKLNALK